MSYVLTVGWSSSPAFARVRALVDAIPGATTDGAGRAWTAHVPVDRTATPQVAELLTVVVGWRQTRLRWDATPLPGGALVGLQRVLACAQAATVADAGALHCWGLTQGVRYRLPCRYLHGLLPWRPAEDPGHWAAAVNGAARLQGVVACPYYDPAAMRAAIAGWAAGQDPCDAALAALGPVGPARRALARLLDDIDLGDGT